MGSQVTFRLWKSHNKTSRGHPAWWREWPNKCHDQAVEKVKNRIQICHLFGENKCDEQILISGHWQIRGG